LLHRWLTTWNGVGLITVGVERQGLRFSRSHIAEGEWRAYFMGNPIFAPEGVRRSEVAVAGGAAGGVVGDAARVRLAEFGAGTRGSTRLKRRSVA
jgi:hypothetical protein